jgi:hypothetical protein
MSCKQYAIKVCEKAKNMKDFVRLSSLLSGTFCYFTSFRARRFVVKRNVMKVGVSPDRTFYL